MKYISQINPAPWKYIKGMHFTRLCNNYFHDYGSPGKVVAIFDLCKWDRKNAPKTCVPILNYLVCKEVCICQIICFYPYLQYQALFELLTAPLFCLRGSAICTVGLFIGLCALFKTSNNPTVRWPAIARLLGYRYFGNESTTYVVMYRLAIISSLYSRR